MIENDTTSANRTSSDSQDRVFALLGAPSTYGCAEVRRIDTHAASVFLAGDKAYKVKRNVRFPFLDYSSLEKRHAACLSELDVNRRFAPALYRRVVPITREPNGDLALDGKGEPVEWAVEMTRFDESRTLDHLAATNGLNAALCRKLGRAVAAIHERAAPADAKAWLAALRQYASGNTRAFRQHPGLFDQQMVSDLDQRSHATIIRLLPLLQDRAALGLVRRGHGDLHLGNLALVDEEPLAFDAIEFDPVIASGDVLYDLAFLLMDLVERGLVDLSNVVLNEYFGAARRSADLDGIAALPLFMSLRAAIRANVTAARLLQVEHKDRPIIEASARGYFDLALKLLHPTRPAMICTAGLSGTGKSVLAQALAPVVPPLPGALILRSDVERKAMMGVSENQRLPPEAYGSDITTKLYDLLGEKAGRIARAGHSVIVDAVFARQSERTAIEAGARRADVLFCGLFQIGRAHG